MRNDWKSRGLAGITALAMAVALAGTCSYQQSLAEVRAEEAAKEEEAETLKETAEETAREEEAETLKETAEKALGDSSDSGENTDEAFKEETVYVKADSTGRVTNTTVTEWLKNPGSGTFEDVSALEGIENIKGEEEFTTGSGDELNWQSEGNDIYYQGTTDQELPVNVGISYKLDGKDISPEDLEGKDGKVEIHIDYENLSKETVDVDGGQVEMYTPFTMITALMLSTDEYSNITIDSGKIVSDADKNIIIGIAFPGMTENLGLSDAEELDIDIPESVTITADAKGASVGPTITIASAELMEEFDLDDVSDFDDLADSIGELEDAADQLAEGSKDVADGARELADGANTLADGTKELTDGLNTLNGKSGDLISGVNTLASGLNTYVNGVGSLAAGSASVTAGADAVNAGVKQFQAGVKSAKDGVDQIAAGYEGDTGAMAGVQGIEDALAKLQGAAAAGTSSGITEDQIAAIASQAAESTMQELEKSVTFTDAQKQAIVSAYTQGIKTTLQELVAGVDEGIAESSGQLQNGISQIQTGVGQLSGGMQQLYAGTKDLQSGLGTLAEGSDSLAAGTSELSGGAAALQQGAAALNQSGSLLTAGTSELQNGGIQLKNGVGQLANGANQAAGGSGTLADGSRQLADGSQQLAEGMSEFKTEGINQLAEVFGGDIQAVTSRIQAMIHLGKDYKSFAGIKDGMNGSTRFIIETVGVDE